MSADEAAKITPMSRPINVVLIDHSTLHQIGWAEKFAKSATGFRIILLTDKSPSRIDGPLEVINVHDVVQNLTLDELQKKVNFSLYRAIVPERAYFDYTTFSGYKCYSRVDLEKIGELIRPHINALDEIIRTRADLVINWIADNAISSLAAHIAQNYGKPHAAPFQYYWWSDGFIFLDRPDQTSSQVDELYRQYYGGQKAIDRAELQARYSKKLSNFLYRDSIVYPFSARIKRILGSYRWYDPFSLANWLVRRSLYPASELMTACFTRTLNAPPADRRYLLYPMNVAPEATLLGSSPELADQFSLIKNISMNLPWGIQLCVKKHPEQQRWTGPGFDFYRKLGALKNVSVIDAQVDAKMLLRDEKCIGVVTINGTVGLEAAINRKPVIVFGKALYGIANCVLKPTSFEEFRSQVTMIVDGRFTFDETAMWSILAALNASVWHGDAAFGLAKSGREATLNWFSAIEAYIRSLSWQRPNRNGLASRGP